MNYKKTTNKDSIKALKDLPDVDRILKNPEAVKQLPEHIKQQIGTMFGPVDSKTK